MAALLSANDVRIDVGGAPAVDGLTLETNGERVIVIGAPRALFEAACGLRAVARGVVAVRGLPAIEAVRGGHVAGAPSDAPLPPDMTPREYVTWSARLAGHETLDARMRADEAITKLGLAAFAAGKLANAALVVKRATTVAAAVATGARAIVLDDPLVELEPDIARSLAHAITSSLEGRAWMVFMGRAPIDSPLVLAADEAVVLAGASVAASGQPRVLAALDRSFAIDVHGHAAMLADRLRASGAHVTTDPRGPRLVVNLGPQQTTRDVLACAAEIGAVVVELRPIAGAFA